MKRFHLRLRPTALVATLLAVTLLPAALLAQPPGRGGSPGGMGPMGGGPGHFGPHAGGPGSMEHRLDRLAERLGLTPEQRDSIAAIRASFRDTLTAQRQATFELHQSLRGKVHADTLDETAIRATAEQLAQAQADLAVTQAQMLQQVRQVLTPEQLAQLDGLRQLRQERMEARRQRMEERRNASDQ